MMTVSEEATVNTLASDLDSEAAERGDQLPSLEEARMNSTSSLTVRSGNRSKWLIIGGFGICLILIIVLSIVLATNKDSDGSGNNKAQAPPQDSSTRTEDIVSFVLQEGISSSQDVANPASAQSKAIKFMAQDDELQLEVPDSMEDAGSLQFVQRYALSVIYYALNGDQWISNLRFLSPNPVCLGWYQLLPVSPVEAWRFGVYCNADDKVVFLHVPQFNVTGTIPPEIGQLSKLQILDLQRNTFLTGPLPDTMAALTDLDYFMMDYCSITGQVPTWIGSLRKLQFLSFSYNFLEGPIPASMEHLSNLRMLALDENILSGELTPLRKLTNLERIYLEDNAFEDDLVNADFSRLTKLIRIDLSSNRFYGNIPSYWLSLDNLTVLDLHSNDFSGPIPDISTENDSLEFLFLYNNTLSSYIPSTISNLKNLTHLDLSLNELTGTITTHIGRMTTLTHLFLANNPFTPSPIPMELFDLENLKDLSLKGTKRTDSIPTEIGNLQALFLLDLDNNDLIGTIPSEIGKLSELQLVLLNRNLLDGPIPLEMGDLSSLVFFAVDDNDITGTMDLVCQNWTNLGVMIADCVTEVTCEECCTLCCADDEAPCNDGALFAAYDPIWELRYGRQVYNFGGANLTFQAPSP